MARILIVDDEEYVLDLLQDVLEEAGHTVEMARDGVEAIAAFTRRPSDLVITDILMPNRGGLSLIKDLRKQNPGVPVIAISGGGKDGKLRFLQTAKTYPGVRGLDKPFREEELLDTVNKSLGWVGGTRDPGARSPVPGISAISLASRARESGP